MAFPMGQDPFLMQFLNRAMASGFGAQGNRAYPGPVSTISGMLQSDLANGGMTYQLAQALPMPTYQYGAGGMGGGFMDPRMMGGFGMDPRMMMGPQQGFMFG
jgi:hypothetical protein